MEIMSMSSLVQKLFRNLLSNFFICTGLKMCKRAEINNKTLTDLQEPY